MMPMMMVPSFQSHCQSRGRLSFRKNFVHSILPVSFGREEILRVVGPFSLMSMSGEVKKKDTQGVNV